MGPLATPDELETWMDGEAPDNALVLLRSASSLVRRATVLARYDTDDDGTAQDDTVRGALRDATLAQAATWAALGIDPVAGAAGSAKEGQVAGTSIGGASVQYAVYASSTEARAAAASSLSDEAVGILSSAGLLTGVVYAW